jgi:hypothetical protein
MVVSYMFTKFLYNFMRHISMNIPTKLSNIILIRNKNLNKMVGLEVLASIYIVVASVLPHYKPDTGYNQSIN